MPLKILRWHSGTSTASRKQLTAWLELFFDLVFALPIAGLAQSLYNHLTPGGFLAFTGLFLTVWWTWYSLVSFANRFEPDDRLYQATLLAGMLCTIVLAVNIENTLNGLATGFILMYAALQAFIAGLYLRQWHRMQEAPDRTLALRSGLGFAGAALLWLVTIWLPVPLRYVIWGLALLIAIVVPYAVALMLKSLPSSTSYLTERLTIFTLIVFGALIIQSGIGLISTPWQVSSATTAISGFIITACMWWLYFSHTDAVTIQHATASDEQEQAEQTRNLHRLTRLLTWSAAYLLIYGSLTVTSAGIARAVAETSRQLGSGTSLALSVSTAVLLLAITLLHQISPHPLPRYKLVIRLSAAIVALVLAFVAVWLGPPVLAGLLAFTLLATTVLENAQYRQPDEMAQRRQERQKQQEQSSSGASPEPTA